MTGRAAAGMALVTALVQGALAAPQRPAFSSHALGVRVDVLVTDGRKPVAGLTAADFRLLDNGVEQTFDLVGSSDVPINAVLALDTSASTTGERLRHLVAASASLLDGLKPADRASLITFSHAVAPRVALTSDLKPVRSELARISPSGETSIMDGVYTALTVTLAQTGRSLIVVCTDGYDVSSWLEPSEVIDAARRSNAVVYAAASADTRRSSALRDLAEATGGQVLPVRTDRDLGETFRRILAEFRSRYVLAYSPSGVAPEGFHTLDVRVTRGGLKVKARPGYVGVGSAARRGAR